MTGLFEFQFYKFLRKQHSDLQSLQAQSTGEDSNSSDTVASDAGDNQLDSMNGSMDHSRSANSFANSFLGLQNLPGLLPGPSGMPDNFGKSNTPSLFLPFVCFINKNILWGCP